MTPPQPSASPPRVVVMGVAGSGKSTVGRLLAERLGVAYIEGDDFHPPENIRKMRAGIALTDADRHDWLQTLGQQLVAQASGAVLSCSALKRGYRDSLRASAQPLHFVFLDLTQDQARSRVEARSATHLFPTSLVDSQFKTLERPQDEPRTLRLDAMLPPPDLVQAATSWLAQAGNGTH